MSRIDLKKVFTISLIVTSSFLAGCGGGGGGSGSTSSTGTVVPTGSSTDYSSPLPIYNGSTGTGTGTATLKWVAPSTRLDGSAISLSELAGYVVYTGTSPSSLKPQLTITDPTATQYQVTNLDSGQHYFALVAYDTAGRRSSLSQVVNKLI